CRHTVFSAQLIQGQALAANFRTPSERAQSKAAERKTEPAEMFSTSALPSPAPLCSLRPSAAELASEFGFSASGAEHPMPIEQPELVGRTTWLHRDDAKME
ncbi:MAG: hypothetical protein ABMA26_12665, partial [Limisphaerales bacterium]